MPSLAKNKKAYFDYEILDTLEAGIQLTGAEVKSIKNHQANLKGSHVTVRHGEVFAEKIHISPYKHASHETDPVRSRKLLLHSKEIAMVEGKIMEKGIAVLPLEFYTKQALIKLKIGIGRGKKKYDKRETLKRKAQKREIEKVLKTMQ